MKNKRTGSFIAILVVMVVLALECSAMAAEVRPFILGSGTYRAIVIEGRIKPGDFDTFVRIAHENKGTISGVYIFSPGGDFDEAMKIGRAMRALELSSQVPMRTRSGRASCEEDGFSPTPKDPQNCTCASAGFFIHIGGVHRGGTYLAVHRPYFDRATFASKSQAEAEKAFNAIQDSARSYMAEMGVPEHIQADVLGTSSDRALLLDEKTVKTYFWGELPYRHEWAKSRCSRLTESEEARARDYTARLLSARSASKADLTKDEWADLTVLQKKQDEELNCKVTIDKDRRKKAYDTLFGTKASSVQ